MYFFFIPMLILFIAMIAYVIIRSIKWFSSFCVFTRIHKIIYSLVFTLFGLSFFIGMSLPASSVKSFIYFYGGIFTGFFIYLLITIVIMDIIGLIRKLLRKNALVKTHLFVTGFVCIVLSSFITAYGYINAAVPQTVSYDIIIKNPSVPDGYKVGLISDLHIGEAIGADHIKKVVEELNRSECDIVLISGDVFNGNAKNSKDLSEVAFELQKIESKNGVYASLGNHDKYPLDDLMIEFFSNANIIVLSDEKVELDYFNLIGRIDISQKNNIKRSPLTDLLSDVNVTKPTIVIDHQPKGIDEAAYAKIDLVLSGHTHAGQLFPANIFAAFVNGFDRFWGHEIIGDTQAVITCGVGYWGPPIRVLTKNEVVVITLHPEK